MTTRQKYLWKLFLWPLGLSGFFVLILTHFNQTAFWIWFAIVMPIMTYYTWFVRDKINQQ
jgi:hypothetical protein